LDSAFRGTPGRLPTFRFLGDRNYSVWINELGSGGSFSGDILLTPFHQNRDNAMKGVRIFLRDLESGKFGIIGQITSPQDEIGGKKAHSAWKPGVFSIFHELDGIEARLDICVAPGVAAEIRKVTLVNLSGRPRKLDLTSFAEVVLNRKEAHQSHPVFSKLFLQTEFDESRACLMINRRPRDPQDSYPLLVHAFLGSGNVEHETSRPRFLGRGRQPQRPAALASTESLSGTTGNVLDPIVSLRRSFHLEPGGKQEFAFLLGTAADQPGAADLIDSFRTPDAVTAVFQAASASANSQLEMAGVLAHEEKNFQDLASAVIFGHPAVTPRFDCQKKSKGRIGDLVRLGISPRLDWVVVHAETPEGAVSLELMTRAARRWRELDLPIQLVVVNGENRGSKANSGPESFRVDAADLTLGEFYLLNTAARLVITESLPDLSIAPDCSADPGKMGRPSGAAAVRPEVRPHTSSAEPLRFFNGWGGFNQKGDEYVIRLTRDPEGRLVFPPLPWINVVANDQFGFLVSESGAGCTWYGNSRENRLTPWSNDPVRDPHADAFYVRDEDSGEYWSCMPGPVPGNGDYEVRHGFGYTRTLYNGADLRLDTTMFAARSDPLRITRISVTNNSGRQRRISLFSCAQLVLGDNPRQSGRFVTTWLDDQTGALLARNSTSESFPRCVAFAAVVTDPAVEKIHQSCSLAGFLGPEGSFFSPAALDREFLDGRVDPETESCFAHQAVMVLDPGQTAQVSFLLGQEADADWARELAGRYLSSETIEKSRREAVAFWREGLSSLRVETPSPALDIMVNGWLPYQTLSCRIRGRTAFFQSGGAFGFRDQLQDASSLLPLWPEKTRQQILLHAAHQFVEGDVLHWWHPPHSRGIRTRFADDLLWLPLLTAEYIQATGDEGILGELIPYLCARNLEPGEDEVFLDPEPSGESTDLYEHCCRAIDRSLALGNHGLPLFGTGDWNDGMNRVGREGRGESVWMGFFLVMVLDGFGPFCQGRGDQERADRYRSHRRKLEQALNDSGWDGGWYRRGYYDDGSPLGSHQNQECRIDALAQAWAVLSEVAPPDRAEQALRALEENLVSEDPGLIKLLAPPFVDTPRDPGYIKGYVAGVRENGGQYTHAALWVVRALAKARKRDKAARFLDLLNPILHAATPEQVSVYKAEPYVIAADVYGASPHVGRGGWTWYTGSSAWMHRVAVESVLGLRTEGGHTLVLEPCIPDQWPGFVMTWKIPGDGTTWRIAVTNPDSCSACIRRVTVDGAPVATGPLALRIPLVKDGKSHAVEVTLGAVPQKGTGS
jgi:cellobiose phosphorylase